VKKVAVTEAHSAGNNEVENGASGSSMALSVVLTRGRNLTWPGSHESQARKRQRELFPVLHGPAGELSGA
jgi:hypothetical protein